MFTGIVQGVGHITEHAASSDGVRMAISGAPFHAELKLGDSVSVSGCCLTAVELSDELFRVDAVAATMARTTVGDWSVGQSVNLEPALKAGDPLGGHMVQGHVDGVGRVESVESHAEGAWLSVELPAGVDEITVPQGSLAIDGVSLTVNELAGGVARFAIIPYTWTHTTLGKLQPGARVNVEADMIGKYVDRAIRPYASSAST